MDVSGIQAELVKKRREFAEMRKQVLKAKKGLKHSQQRKRSSTEQLKGKLTGSGGGQSILQDSTPKSETQPKTSAEPSPNGSQAEMCNVVVPPCTSLAATASSLTAVPTQISQEKECATPPVNEPDSADIANRTSDVAVASSRVLTCSSGDDSVLTEIAPSSASPTPWLGVKVVMQNPSAANSVSTQASHEEASSPIEHEIIQPQVFALSHSEVPINSGEVSSFDETSKFSSGISVARISQATATASDFYLPDDGFGLLKLKKLQLQSGGNVSAAKRLHGISSMTLLSVGKSDHEVFEESDVEMNSVPKQQWNSPTHENLTCQSENISPLIEQDPMLFDVIDPPVIPEVRVSQCDSAKEYSSHLGRGLRSLCRLPSTTTSSLLGCFRGALHCKCNVTRFEPAGEGGRVTEVTTSAPCSYHFQMEDYLRSSHLETTLVCGNKVLCVLVSGSNLLTLPVDAAFTGGSCHRHTGIRDETEVVSVSAIITGNNGRGCPSEAKMEGKSLVHVAVAGKLRNCLVRLSSFQVEVDGRCNAINELAIDEKVDVCRDVSCMECTAMALTTTTSPDQLLLCAAFSTTTDKCCTSATIASGTTGGTAGGIAGDGTTGGTADGTADGTTGGTAGGTADGIAGDGSTGGTTGGTAGGTADGTADGIAGDGSTGGTTGGTADGIAGGGTTGGTADGTGTGTGTDNTSSTREATTKSVLLYWRLHSSNGNEMEVKECRQLPLPEMSTVSSLVWAHSVEGRGEEEGEGEGEEGEALLVGVAGLTAMIWNTAVCELMCSVRLTCCARPADLLVQQQWLIGLRAFQEVGALFLMLAYGGEGDGLRTPPSGCWLLALPPNTSNCFRVVKAYHLPTQIAGIPQYHGGRGHITHSAVTGSRACVWRLASSIPHLSFTFTGMPSVTALSWEEDIGWLLVLDSSSLLHVIVTQ